MGGERVFASGKRVHFPPEVQEMHTTPEAKRMSVERAVQKPTRARPGLLFPARKLFWQGLFNRVRAALAKDAARGAAFLFIPVFLGAGAASYFVLPQEPATSSIIAAICLVAAGAYLARGRQMLFALVIAALVFLLGIAAAKLETWRAATPMVGSEITTRITGRVVQVEHQASGRVRLTLDVLATERPHLRYAPARVRVTGRSAPDGLQPGDGVSGVARLMPSSGPLRPGGYDFGFNSYFRGIGASGFFMTGPDRVERQDPLPIRARAAQMLEGVRLALAERIRSHVEGADGEIAVALIVGYRPGIPEDVNEWLRRSGLTHILSISGVHMALVALTVMTILRTIAALFTGASSRFPVKKFAVSAALAFCTLYLSVSGGDVAALRSYIMLAVMLAALLFDRAAITMRNVAIAAIVIIILSPHEIMGPSFQMSFSATAALVAGYAAWTTWRSRRKRGPAPSDSHLARGVRVILGLFAGMALTSLIAGTASTLYGVWHFQRVAPMSLAANLAATPLVSLIIMPSAVLAMLAMPFGFEGFFLKLMSHGIVGMVAIGKWFSDRSPLDAVGLLPASALLFFTAAMIVLVVSTTWLRAAAIPLLLLGIMSIVDRQLPDVLVAEDGRLIGVRHSEGQLLVNRTRPRAFTLNDWTRAMVAEKVVKPKNGSLRPSEHIESLPDIGFSCGDGLCLARHESGALIAHAQTPAAALAACNTAALIVLEDAATSLMCGAGAATIITKRDLARRGAAAIHLISERGRVRAEPTFAIGEGWRPWHDYRAWSRAARGLPPYRSKRR